MNWKIKIRDMRKKIPVRMVLFIVLIVFFATGYFYSEASAKVSDIASLLYRILLLIFSSIVFFSISTVTIAHIKSSKKPEIKFRHTDDGIVCEVKCGEISFPFAGNLKAELVFDKRYVTVVALKRKKGKTATGEKKLTLPDIKNYNLETVTLFFQDFFRMFSFQKTYLFKSSVSILPVGAGENLSDDIPSAQYDDEIKTDTYRRREGEFLRFKHFESSDDIRRIVWSVYARSKELIVRTVEMLSLYASQIELYVSFNNMYAGSTEQSVSDMFLNHYKTMAWEIYLSLKAKGEVHFVPDQKTKIAADYRFEVAAQIAGMSWHSNNVADYFVGSRSSVCCISSLVSYPDVEKLMDILDENTVVILVSLKSVAGKISVGGLLKKIFTISDEKDNWRWLFSSVKRQIDNNEIKILNILKSRNIKYFKL